MQRPNPTSTLQPVRSRLPLLAAVVLLLTIFAQCLAAAHHDSVTWDESQHLYSGLLAWRHADFGVNPEVPPLIKLWCALPLLHRHIAEPALTGDFFKKEAYVLGQQFLARNGIAQTLLPARTMAACLTTALGLVLFLTALQFFGPGPALFALALFAFDPNFLAHGAFVTTDVGASLLTLLSVYLFYRYVVSPSGTRLLLAALAASLLMTAKFTGILILPIFFLLAIAEVWSTRTPGNPQQTSTARRQSALRFTRALAVIAAVCAFCLWAIYGFRYQARPGALALNPAAAAYEQGLHSAFSRAMVSTADRWHLLPQAYLYGLADTAISASEDTSYFFGWVYLHAPRLYFPAALVIKSTLPFLLLLLTAGIVLATRRWHARRQILFLLIPSAVFFFVAMFSDIGIGFRHLFPIVPLLYILGASAAWHVLGRDRRWRYALALLLVWQVATSVAALPGRLAYANEAWGGPSKTHLYLSDSNVDWGQQLKSVKTFLDGHAGQPCYFAYFEQGAVDYRDYGIHCRQLPTSAAQWVGMGQPSVALPPIITGLVLISDGELEGINSGAGLPNPWDSFRNQKPVAVLDHGVFVYQGTFAVPLASALEHVYLSRQHLAAYNAGHALAEARQAVALAPDNVATQSALGDALAASHRPLEARAAYAAALHIAQTVDPELQQARVPKLQAQASGQPFVEQ